MINSKPIKCPQCGHLTIYSAENPFRPFCSERCKTLDLGDWANEKFKIPVKEYNEDFEQNSDESDGYDPSDPQLN